MPSAARDRADEVAAIGGVGLQIFERVDGVGGSFGAGFNLAHGYGYIRGRAAAVILPERLDVEISAQWTPRSASTSDYDEQTWRISAWYRLNEKSGRAAELYVETFSRVDADPMTTGDREIVDGAGAGVGFSFF